MSPPEPSVTPRPAFDFEMGSEWADPQALFQAIASSAKASAPAGQATGDSAEPLPEPAGSTDLPELPIHSAEEPPPAQADYFSGPDDDIPF